MSSKLALSAVTHPYCNSIRPPVTGSNMIFIKRITLYHATLMRFWVMYNKQ
jgi:hypothetical protein